MEGLKTLSIDIETYSDVSLKECGVYKYVDSENFRILLFAYAFDDEDVKIVDLENEEKLPKRVIAALLDKNVIKTAFNAQFERVCINKYLGIKTENWECTMIKALSLGFPGSLDSVGKVVGIESDKQKLMTGKNLIRIFSIPRKVKKDNQISLLKNKVRILPEDRPEEWKQFKEYCIRDVETERAIRNKLSRFKTIPEEKKLYQLDQKINDRGVLIDLDMAENAIAIDTEQTNRLTKTFIEVTGLENPNSLTDLKKYIKSRTGKVVKSITKSNIQSLKDKLKDYDDIITALDIRQRLSKTSISKYKKMIDVACSDNRARGLLQFYGANRTGRWCLTGDHEVLTQEGWVRLDEWQGGCIACWSSQTEVVSFQKSKNLSFDYTGEMLKIETQRISQISTPDHKMPYWNKNGGWGANTIENLSMKRYAIPFTGNRILTTNNDHSQLRVLIMTQADGFFTNEGDVRFHFSKQRKIERCKKLLREAGIYFIHRSYDKSDSIVIKNRCVPLWLRAFKEKKFGWWLLDESADVIFDEIKYWDGYQCGPNSVQYSTIVKENADIIQACAHLSGRSAVIVEKHRKKNWSTAYMVNIWLTPGNRHEIRKKPEKLDYKGKVYCAETPTGYFLVRRNGRVWITGNSGRLIQVQNLPQNHIKDLDIAREIVKNGDLNLLEMMYDNPSDILSQCIRPAIIPSPGYKFAVADFSAIEARVIAWLAGEKWRLDVFNSHGKIYEASAAQMFNVPIESIHKGDPLRQKGKVAELALGYQGAAGALVQMGALKMGLTEEELPELVKQWRASNPKIVKFWYDTEAKVMEAIANRSTVKIKDNLKAIYKSGILFIELPSGRRIAYVKPKIVDHDKFPGKQKIVFQEINEKTYQWDEVDTYGGKLVENIVQATARDCLAHSMINLDKAGYEIVMHVHDEVIIEIKENRDELKNITDIMGQEIPWAKGLPLRADGYECKYYMKD